MTAFREDYSNWIASGGYEAYRKEAGELYRRKVRHDLVWAAHNGFMEADSGSFILHDEPKPIEPLFLQAEEI